MIERTGQPLALGLCLYSTWAELELHSQMAVTQPPAVP